MVSKEFIRDAHLAFLEAWEVTGQLAEDGMDQATLYEAAESVLNEFWPSASQAQ